MTADEAWVDEALETLDETLMAELLEAFSRWTRLSATPEAERSVDWLSARLEGLGVAVTRHVCPLYVSDPVAASLTLPEYPQLAFMPKTRSFSAHCPRGVSGELVHDPYACEPATSRERVAWYEAHVRGRIVIADNGFEDYVERLTRYGALGLIHVWGSFEPAVHEETVGPVWGTPTPDDRVRLPRLPVIGISQPEGRALRAAMADSATPPTATLTTRVETRVADTGLPVAEIPGESDEFVLLSSHYDSWHVGVTDNATGNALCLAMAELFQRHRRQLRRGLRIAWWPGHSNARYGGSTWYADRFRDALRQRCVAHINVDSPGCRGGEVLVVNGSGAEDDRFLTQALQREAGAPPERIGMLGRGADQSFWGMDIALHLALKELPHPQARNTRSPGCGGGWWWHTEADTLDKVDYRHLGRDARIHARWLATLLCDERLPVDIGGYLARLDADLVAFDAASDPALDGQPMRRALARLQPLAAELERRWRHDPVRWQGHVRRLLGELHRLRHASVDAYHFDVAHRAGPFPGLRAVADVSRSEGDPATWLFAETLFYRQRDRVVDGFMQLADGLERAISET